MFKNELHRRILAKKCIEHHFQCYFECFVWMIKNAFHNDKIFIDFIPKSLNFEIEKETGRKYIKMFLKNSIILKKCLNRDINSFEEFFDNFKQEMTDNFIKTTKVNNQYLYMRIFDGDSVDKAQTNVRYLEDAVRFLITKLK